MKLINATLILTFIGLSLGDTLSVNDGKTAEAKVETVYVESAAPCAYGKDEVLSFADKLFEIGDYDRAMVEYLRYGFLYPDEPCADMALFRAALCSEYSKKFQRARKIYRQLQNEYSNSASQFTKYRIPLTYFLEGKLDSALQLASVPDTSAVYGAMEYLRGWILLKQQKYREAGELFASIAQKTADSSDVIGSLSYLEKRCLWGQNLPQRSPFLAGLLSAVLPGLGRGYCGRWGDGLFSLITIGIPTSMSIYLWETDRNFASITAAIAALFYLGNIYGSAKGASIYNEQKRRQFWLSTWNEVPHPPTMLYSDMPCKYSKF